MEIRTKRGTRQFFLISFYMMIILGGFVLFYLDLFDVFNVSKDCRGFIAIMSFAVVALTVGIGFGEDDEKTIPKMLRLLMLFCGSFLAVLVFRIPMPIALIPSIVVFFISIAIAKWVKKHDLHMFAE